MFSDDRMVAFRARMTEFLRKQFPDECGAMSDPELDTEIRDGIARARSYGLTTERELSMYLTLERGLGRGLHEDEELAWARRLLGDKKMEGSVRLGFIFKMLSAHEERSVKSTA